MGKKIKIKIKDLEIEAELNISKTAQIIYDKLPLKSKVNLWGEEIYFDVPIKIDLEDGYSREVVEKGDLGYWPEGPSFCIFFGPTPISKGKEIIPASKINLIGRVIGEPKVFKKVKEGDSITIERDDV